MIVTIKKKFGKSIIPEHLRASALIPVLAYNDDDYVFLMDDHSVGFGFMCDPLCGSDEKIQERMNGFLNQDFPPKTTLQIMLFRSPDIIKELYRMMGLRDGFRHELLTSVIKERINFLQHHTLKGISAKTSKGIYDNGLIQDLKLFITCKVPIKGNIPTENELLQHKQLRTKTESALQTVGLRPRSLTAESYIRLMSTILNWGPDASWRHDSMGMETDKPICEQIFDYATDIEVSSDGIRLGDYHVKVMSAKKLPAVAYFGDALTYVGDLTGGNSSIKENYMVVTNVFFPNAETTKNTLERKRQFTVNQAYGPMLKFVPVLADKKESFDTLYESMKEGQKPLKITYSVVLFAPTKERVEAAAMAASTLWRESGFNLMEDKFVVLPMFINCLPFCTDREAVRDLFRYKTMTSEQAAAVVPVFGEWKREE